MGVRPHDLLRLTSPDALEAVDAPGWVARSLGGAPWVVVRRSGVAPDRIAVGVRGETRAERFAAFVAAEAILERLGPEDLRDRTPLRRHAAFDAMAALRPALDATGLAWGPAGAAGFELATALPVLTDASDLDLVLRGDRPPEREALVVLVSHAARMPLPVDILLEMPGGAVAVRDLLGDDDEVLCRTSEGPRLTKRRDLMAAPC